MADASGATDLEIEITPLPFGATTTLNCVDPTPDDGSWSCLWQPGSLTNLTGFDLRARAQDRFGNISGWSPVHHLIVDTTPPTITADAAVGDYLADGFINTAELVWRGRAEDDHEVNRVAVCLDGVYTTGCATASVSLPAPTVAWLHDFSAALTGDGISQTVSFHGFDAVGNRSLTPLVRTFTVDTVPPVINVAQPVHVGGFLGIAEMQVYSGTVSDGGGVARMAALVVPPDGFLRAEPIALSGAGWRYSPRLDQLGQYLIQITATDRAGNISSTGLFTLVVTNRPPLTLDDSYATTADLSFTIKTPGVLVNDTDPDGDALTVVAYDNPSALGAGVYFTPQGEFEYDPTGSPILAALLPGESMTDTLAYTVGDGHGNTVSATVYVLVSAGRFAGCAVADVNRDDRANIVDIGLVTGHWGLTASDPGWNPAYDVVVNGVIDVADVSAAAACWGYAAPRAARGSD